MIQLHTSNNKHQNKILRVPLRITISILIFGILFKIMHWPYANIIIVSAFSLIAVFYLIRFLYKEGKTSLDVIKLTLILSWSFNGITVILHLPNYTAIKLITPVCFLVWIFMEGLTYFNNEPQEQVSKRQFLMNGLYSVAITLTSIGILFKVMHWPTAGPLLVSGISLAAISFFIEMFIQNE